MKKLLFIIPLALALAGCETQQEQQDRVESLLPPGCQIKEIGSYGGADHVVVVWCTGRKTQSVSWRERHGKTHRDLSSIVIEEPNK